MPFMTCPKCDHKDHATGVDHLPCTSATGCAGIMVPDAATRMSPDRFGPKEASRPRPTDAERAARDAAVASAGAALDDSVSGEKALPPPPIHRPAAVEVQVHAPSPDRFVKSMMLRADLPSMGPAAISEAAREASGGDLDTIATHIGLVRTAPCSVLEEEDEDLRVRIQEACGRPPTAAAEPDHLADLEREIVRESGALAGDVHRLSPMGDNARWYIEAVGQGGVNVRHLLVRVSGKQIAAFLASGAYEDVRKLAALAVANAVELRAPTCESEPKDDQSAAATLSRFMEANELEHLRDVLSLVADALGCGGQPWTKVLMAATVAGKRMRG